MNRPPVKISRARRCSCSSSSFTFYGFTRRQNQSREGPEKEARRNVGHACLNLDKLGQEPRAQRRDK